MIEIQKFKNTIFSIEKSVQGLKKNLFVPYFIRIDDVIIARRITIIFISEIFVLTDHEISDKNKNRLDELSHLRTHIHLDIINGWSQRVLWVENNKTRRLTLLMSSRLCISGESPP